MNFDQLPDSALLRARQILAPHGPVPFKHSSWYDRVARKLAPQPIRLGSRMTVWRWGDVKDYLQRLAEEHRC